MEELTYHLPDGEELHHIESVEDYYSLPAGTLKAWKNDPRKAVEEACTRWVKANNYTHETVQLIQAKRQILDLLTAVAQPELLLDYVDTPMLHINSNIPACKQAAEFIGLGSVEKPVEWCEIVEIYSNLRHSLGPICVGLGIAIPDESLATEWKWACDEMDRAMQIKQQVVTV